QAADLPTGRIEAFAGDKYTTLDTKVGGTLGKHFNYFGRNITTFDHNEKTSSPFSFIDLSVNVGKGFTLVNETQFIDSSQGTIVTPRLGFEYFGKLSPISTNLTLYTINTVNVPTHRDPLLNGENVTTLTWSPPLGKTGRYSGLLQVEAVTNIGEKGYNFASQNFRAGITTKRFEWGLGVNLGHAPDKKMSYTLGPFASIKF
ncbi:MAG: hypothetical protein AABY00_02020, partial [Nanoarchaeota archaeon]